MHFGNPFANKDKEGFFDSAISLLRDGNHSLMRWWARKYNRPIQDPLLLGLSHHDIILEQMEDYIEHYLMETEGADVKDLKYFDLFPDEDPDGFEKFLAEAQTQTETLDEAYHLARRWQKEGR